MFCVTQTVVHEAGLVPKSMYLPGEEMDAARQHLPMSDQSIYRSVSLGRGQVGVDFKFLQEQCLVLTLYLYYIFSLIESTVRT